MTKLDIIAVTYNQNENLKCFINSIKAQTSFNWRLFILHDGLNKELKEDLKNNNYLSGDIEFIEHPTRTGHYGHCLRKWAIDNVINNEYTLLTNGDNYYVPTMVQEVLNKSEDLVYFDCVHSHITNINHNKTSYGYMNCKLVPNNIDIGCARIRTSLVKKVNFKSNHFSADWDFFNDIINEGATICKIDKVLFVHN